MFVQGFGEVLTDALTVNPALADLPAASSILDTSNFTFQAVAFGKDAGGFVQHSHVIYSIQYVNGNSASGASSYDLGLLNIVNYASDAPSGASSYIPSGTYLKFLSTYDSVPNYPSVGDTRLERGSTLNANLSGYQYASALPDLGHYANPALDSQLSSIWNKVGGFAPSGAATTYWYQLYDKDVSLINFGNVSSFFNGNQLMDKDGYLTISPSSVSQNPAATTDYTEGSVMVSSTINSRTPSEGRMILKSSFYKGDAVSMAAFGGVKHVGVYCLDLKEMLNSSLIPPYGWDALNNIRKYKLVAKVTILDDAFYNRDGNGEAGIGKWLTDSNVTISLDFDFK
jgi:hypothetical protein